MKTGKNIQTIREIKGVKQAHLASLVSLTQQRLSQIENGDEVEEKLLLKIAGALDTTPEAIKTFEKEYVLNNLDLADRNSQNTNYQIIMMDKLVNVYENHLKDKEARIEFLEKMLFKIIDKK